MPRTVLILGASGHFGGRAARTWSYLPDMARAAVARAAHRENLSACEDVPFPGLAFSTRALARAVTGITGQPMRIRRFPWWLPRAASPCWELARELTEMRCLHDHPHWLDGAKLDRLLPGFAMTPLAGVLARFPATSGRRARLPSPPESAGWRGRKGRT